MNDFGRFNEFVIIMIALAFAFWVEQRNHVKSKVE